MFWREPDHSLVPPSLFALGSLWLILVWWSFWFTSFATKAHRSFLVFQTIGTKACEYPFSYWHFTWPQFLHLPAVRLELIVIQRKIPYIFNLFPCFPVLTETRFSLRTLVPLQPSQVVAVFSWTCLILLRRRSPFSCSAMPLEDHSPFSSL